MHKLLHDNHRSSKSLHAYVITLFLCVISLCCTSGKSDTELSKDPLVFASQQGHVFFLMYPPEVKTGDPTLPGHLGKGICYATGKEGAFIKLWRVDGWYSHRCYLSQTGEYLVRFGLWGKDQKNHSDLAIAFYRNGSLLKLYSVSDLIQRPESIEHSTSHYRWLPRRQTERAGIFENKFALTLIDKSVYEFDLHTGKILSKSIDNFAAGQRELDEELEAIQRSAANDLLATWSLKQEFDQNYVIKKAMLYSEGHSNVTETDDTYAPCIKLTFTPKRPPDSRCRIDAFFFVENFLTGDDRISMEGDYFERIDKAVRLIIESQRIKTMFSESNDNRFVIRTSENRLYRSRKRLFSRLADQYGEKIDIETLANKWAEVYVYGKYHLVDHFFINIVTGDTLEP